MPFLNGILNALFKRRQLALMKWILGCNMYPQHLWFTVACDLREGEGGQGLKIPRCCYGFVPSLNTEKSGVWVVKTMQGPIVKIFFGGTLMGIRLHRSVWENV